MLSKCSESTLTIRESFANRNTSCAIGYRFIYILCFCYSARSQNWSSGPLNLFCTPFTSTSALHIHHKPKPTRSNAVRISFHSYLVGNTV